MNITPIMTTNLESILIEENKIQFDEKDFNHYKDINQIKNDNKFDFDKLESKKIVHLNAIKKTCISYRLRFLDIHYFKGDIPIEAIDKIKELELDHGIIINSFKIMAPSVMFRLKKTDDPLMFVPIGNNYYYLIHKWGNDLNPLRRIRMWPFHSLKNLLFSLLAVSFLITLMTPLQIFTKSPDSSSFWLLFLFMFKAIVAIVLFLGVALGKNFNPKIWNSKYNKV
tara:strand:+ start:329 stop:1003 length:675 start_codon:yes stop_codon:yes gene_type:complete